MRARFSQGATPHSRAFRAEPNMPDESKIDYKATLNLPDTPFPHLEDSVRALRANNHAVSVDSANTD